MENSQQMYDVIIIGGGPAGLTAGIYATRSLLKTVMLEKMMPGGQVSLTDELENYPGTPGITGIELIAQMEKQAKDFGLNIVSEEVVSIEPGAGNQGHLVKTSKKEYLTKSLIIASGAKPRNLGVKGEAEFTGKGVSYCATCDGAFFRNKEVVVVGGGDSAVEEAIYLTRFCTKVTIVHRRDKLRASKIIQDRAFKNPKINFIWNSTVEEIKGEMGVKEVVLKNKLSGEITKFATNGIFVFIGYIPNNDFLPDVLKRDQGGFIITDMEMKTNIPGIFACGDIRAKDFKQVITACGDAANAVHTAEKYNEWNFEDEQYL